MIRQALAIIIAIVLLAAPALSTLTDSGNLTIADSETDLSWQKEAGPRRTAGDAETYCTGAVTGGYNDWRLPTISELSGLVEPLNNPQISPLFLTHRNSLTYWSGTAVPTDIANSYIFKNRSYVLFFSDGQTLHVPNKTQQRVRCVSDGTCSSTWQAAAVTWQGECIAW